MTKNTSIDGRWSRLAGAAEPSLSYYPNMSLDHEDEDVDFIDWQIDPSEGERVLADAYAARLISQRRHGGPDALAVETESVMRMALQPIGFVFADKEGDSVANALFSLIAALAERAAATPS
jgi:hypothetical protein